VAAGEVGEANSLISLTSGIVYMVAPGAAGLSLALIGPRAAIACLLVLYGGATVILRRLRLPVGRPVDAQTDTFRGDWAAGIRYVRESSLLTALTVANLVSFLGIGALDILDVVFVTRALHQRPEAVGIMLGCLGAGTIVGGFLMTVTSPHMRQAQHRVLAISLTLQGIICLAVSVAPSLAVLVVIQFALGLTVSPSLAAGNTLLQLGSEDTMRGRVMSVYSTSGGVAMLLSMVGGGAAADIWNVRYVLGAGALLILAAGILVVCTVRATPAPLEAGPNSSERWGPAQTAPGVAG
jgi:predicted MFS family arabinose efflux permease